jgi:hypothetical protein
MFGVAIEVNDDDVEVLHQGPRHIVEVGRISCKLLDNHPSLKSMAQMSPVHCPALACGESVGNSSEALFIWTDQGNGQLTATGGI